MQVHTTPKESAPKTGADDKKLNEALRYTRMGWAVLPLWPVRAGRCTCGTQCGKNAGKHPLGTLVRSGEKDATSDPNIVTRWWTRYPDANIGIATGAISGLFALDVDIRDKGDESLAALIETMGPMPETLMSQTGNGGTHLFFKYPGTHVRNSVRELGPGLDIRGDGAYVVAPPSSLGPNKAYTWSGDQNAPVLEAPKWLVERVIGQSSRYDPIEVSNALMGVSEGQRDITMFRLACRFRAAGIPQEFVEELLKNAARACDPPFPEDLAVEKVVRAFRQYNRDYAMTDAGNAERMIDRHGAVLRFSEDGRWLVWNGTRWNGDTPAIALNLAVETTGSILSHAQEMTADTEEAREQRDYLIKHAYASQNIFRLSAMVTLTQADPAIQILATELDSDPYLLNCPNGTVNLRTGALVPHNRADFITKIAGTRYDPEIPTPKWDAFLARFLPDEEVRAFVRRAVGYSLTGSVAEQCLIFLYGSGRNGKSTLVRVIQRIMGQYARTGSPDLLLNNRSDTHPAVLADLFGARLVPTIETEEGKKVAEATTKWLTGGDRLKARRLHRDYFEFDPTFKIWLVANHRPVIYGTDIAIWRRIHMVPFAVQLPEDEVVGDYDQIMFDEEGPGILAWAVRGAMEWYTNGLQPPDSVRAALQEYRSDMDVVGQFLQECTTNTENGVTIANDLYAAYRGWTKLNGETHTTQRRFSNKIYELGYRRDRGLANKYTWNGLELNEVGHEYSLIGLNSVDSQESISLMRNNA